MGSLAAPRGMREAKRENGLPPPPLTFRNHTGAPMLSPAGSQRAREPGVLSIVLTHGHQQDRQEPRELSRRASGRHSMPGPLDDRLTLTVTPRQN